MEKDSIRNVFAWSGFTSCTTDPSTCLKYVDDVDYNCNTVFLIHSGDDKRLCPMMIDEWSQFPEEEEVLFDVRDDRLAPPSFHLLCPPLCPCIVPCCLVVVLACVAAWLAAIECKAATHAACLFVTPLQAHGAKAL